MLDKFKFGWDIIVFFVEFMILKLGITLLLIYLLFIWGNFKIRCSCEVCSYIKTDYSFRVYESLSKAFTKPCATLKVFAQA